MLIKQKIKKLVQDMKMCLQNLHVILWRLIWNKIFQIEHKFDQFLS